MTNSVSKCNRYLALCGVPGLGEPLCHTKTSRPALSKWRRTNKKHFAKTLLTRTTCYFPPPCQIHPCLFPKHVRCSCRIHFHVVFFLRSNDLSSMSLSCFNSQVISLSFRLVSLCLLFPVCLSCPCTLPHFSSTELSFSVPLADSTFCRSLSFPCLLHFSICSL